MTLSPNARRYLVPVLLGALSALLYGTVMAAPIFLVPVQVSGVRSGFRMMVTSALAAMLTIVIWQFALLARSGALGLATAALTAASPAALLLALVLLAYPRFVHLPFVYRVLVAGFTAALLSYPTFAFAAADPSIRGLFDEAFGKAMPGLVSSGIDAGALWDMVKVVVASSFGAILLVFILFSSWIGTRIGLKARAAYPERGDHDDLVAQDETSSGTIPEVSMPVSHIVLPPSLDAYSVPGPLVWALLAAWAAILFNRFVPAPAFAAIAWNVAIALSICYGIQGFAVALALAGRVGLASAARLLAPLTLILLMVSGTAGLVAIGVFTALGTLETWIPFRAAHEGDTP
ncbi:MAG: DUF2232 domain-containing protein [Spirochaetota bacterium]